MHKFKNIKDFVNYLIMYENKLFYITGRKATKPKRDGTVRELWEIIPKKIHEDNKLGGSDAFSKWIDPKFFMDVEDNRVEKSSNE